MKKFLSSQAAQPLIYALCVIIGLLGGKKLYQDQSYRLGFNHAEISKGKLYDILTKIESHYVDTVNLRNIENKTVHHVLDELDPHSYYLSLEESTVEDEHLNGNFSGIGVEFKIIQDTIVVMHPIAHGPSEKAGIKTGDKIIAVNGTNFTGDSITSKLAMQHLKGKRGSRVQVSFLSDKTIKKIDITRAEVPIKSIPFHTKISQEIGYIKIDRFAKKTSAEFNQAVEFLLKEKATKFVIDLRDNPGGLMEGVVKICNELLDKNQMIVYTKGRIENEEYKTQKKGTLADYPVSILINEGSASASEILAGAIQDNDRGIVIGRRSFGKGLVQRPFILKDGSALRLTIARYYTPTGRCIQKPYKAGNTKYYSENYDRLHSGELTSKDSIPIPDSLKFITPGGKVVYGGGGIIPDIFIPADTSGFSIDLSSVFEHHALEYFFLKNLKLWNQMLEQKDLKESYQVLIKNDFIWGKFLEHLESNEYLSVDISKKKGLRNRLEKPLLSRILRLKFHEEGFHFPSLEIDPEIAAAKNSLN